MIAIWLTPEFAHQILTPGLDGAHVTTEKQTRESAREHSPRRRSEKRARRLVIRRAIVEKPPELAKSMPERRKSWLNILFLSLTPVIGVLGTAAYAIAFGVRWWEPALFLVLFGLVSFSVTAGYHRCFAHKAYVCHPAVQAFYLFFGAMALQNSALKWSSDHRDHHRYVDKDWDPYNIKRGGLWAHILWLFYAEPAERTYDNVPDLQATGSSGGNTASTTPSASSPASGSRLSSARSSAARSGGCSGADSCASS